MRIRSRFSIVAALRLLLQPVGPGADPLEAEQGKDGTCTRRLQNDSSRLRSAFGKRLAAPLCTRAM